MQAGILDQRPGDGLVADAVLADDGLTERQKQVLLEIYDSFRKENAASGGGGAAVSLVTVADELPTDLSTVEPEPPVRPADTPRPATARPTTARAGTAGKAGTPPRKRTSGPAASA